VTAALSAPALPLDPLPDGMQVKAVLDLSVENENGEDVPVQYSVAARRGVISVFALNFQFSKPPCTLRVKAAAWKKKYKKAAEANRKKAAGKR